MAPLYLNTRQIIRKITPPFFLGLSLVFLGLSLFRPSLNATARMYVADCCAPFWRVIVQIQKIGIHSTQKIFDLEKTIQENYALRQENTQLYQWYETSLNLMRENLLLKSQLHYLPQHYSSYVSGPVIADNSSGYARALIINGGQREGIEEGNLALSSQGLAGRVLQTGEHTARILLITDSTSRIPVYLLSSHKEAIMSGDNTNSPLLLYYSKETPPIEGETIETDNQPGIQSGVLIGRVHYPGSPATPHISLFTPLDRLEILRIYQFSQPQMSATLSRQNNAPKKHIGHNKAPINNTGQGKP